MAAMRAMEDNAFDLAIVDPPYGIGADWNKRKNNRKRPTRPVATSSATKSTSVSSMRRSGGSGTPSMEWPKPEKTN